MIVNLFCLFLVIVFLNHYIPCVCCLNLFTLSLLFIDLTHTNLGHTLRRCVHHHGQQYDLFVYQRQQLPLSYQEGGRVRYGYGRSSFHHVYNQPDELRKR